MSDSEELDKVIQDALDSVRTQVERMGPLAPGKLGHGFKIGNTTGKLVVYTSSNSEVK